jgi:group I intron endonuclease
LDHFISLHNSVNNIVPTLYKSIEYALFNLGVANYLSLGIIISLIILLLLIFHFNKKLSVIYIRFLITILIITLAYFAYTSGELYINLDSYVNIYNNIKKEEMFFITTVNINRCNFSTFQPFYKQLKYSSTLCNNLLDSFLKNNKLKPVYFYEDIHLDKMRKTILEDTKNLSGIYLIFNKITGDYYIGSAATNRFYARFSNHLLYFRGSKIIKHAVKKYGFFNFAFLILELFPFIVNKENNKNLLDMEDYYLKSLLPNYNILTEAGSSFGYKHTEIDRIKMKLNYSIERCERIGKLKNKKLYLETIEKIRDKALSKKKIFYSDEALLNMKKKSKPIIIYNLNNTVFGEYPSIVEAAKSINCDSKTIRRALKTEKKILKRRFIVKYKE